METQNPETEILSHQEVYRGLIVNLLVDKVRLASGTTVVREVVEHPGGVVVVPVLDDGRILLIRQFRYPLGKFILELPAGKLDSEHSPLEKITQELEEETGYTAGEVSFQFSFHTTPGVSNEIIHLYIARGLKECAQKLEEGEHITVEPRTIRDCLEGIRNGEIADGKTILGLLWYYVNFV